MLNDSHPLPVLSVRPLFEMKVFFHVVLFTLQNTLFFHILLLTQWTE